MSMTFDDSAVKDMMAASFLAAVPREKQEDLLRQAVAEILKKDSGSYSVQQLFREAVAKLAMAEATKLLADNPEFKQQFEAAVQKALELAFDAIGTNLPKFIGEAVARSLKI